MTGAPPDSLGARRMRYAASLALARPQPPGLTLPIPPVAAAEAPELAAGPSADAVPAAAPPEVAAAPNASPPPPSFSSAPAKYRLPSARELQRDPLLPPLPEQPAWQEWLLTVTLNGTRVSQGGLFVEAPGGDGLAAQLALLEAWRVRTDPDRVLTFQGEPYYPLAAIPGATFSLDRQALTLSLEVPPEQFAPTTVTASAEQRPRPVSGAGGFLDYDLLAQAGSDVGQGLSGLVELGTFGSLGTGMSSLRLDDLTAHPGVTRLDTTFSRDLPDSRLSLRFGDSIAVGGAFAAPVRFGGVQYATNFAVDPYFVTFPLPAIGGLARQDSVVDLIIDDLKRETRRVAPGPFTIDSLPVVTGAGEVQLRVTDLLGREQLVSQPYYVSSRLLKAGLSDFSYQAGALRRDYGQRSFDYGDPIAIATHRYGLSDSLTGEAHAEIEPDRQSMALGGSALLGRLGVLTAGVGGSASSAGPGLLGQLGYEFNGRSFDLGLSTRWTSEDFRAAGGDVEPARVDQASLGFDLDRYGRLGLLLLHRDGRDTEDATSLSASYGLPLGPGVLTLRAGQLLQPDHELALTALYTLPLGGSRSASTQIQRRGDGTSAGAQFHQGRGASDLGLDYRLAAQGGDDNNYASARFGYQSRLAGGDLDLERFDGSNNLRAGLNGSLTLVDGELAMSRRIGRAFGLVDLPGFPDVRVYLDNREAGRTDSSGKLLLPDLRPYERNQVRVAVDDLPLDAEITTAETEAVPYDGSGMRIGFPLARTERATVVLHDAQGAPLPAGLKLASADGKVTAWVARDGFSQVTGPLGEGAALAGSVAGARLTCKLPAPAGKEPLPDLGTVTCR